MKIVADKLAEWAVSVRNEDNTDAFGRSAFNRYYYASYLITREMLNGLDASWTYTSHSNIPELLEKAVINKIRKQLKQKEKTGLIAHAQAVRFRNTANTAVSELSNVLKLAYDVRVVADYQPEIKIIREGRKVQLGHETLEGAKNWTKRVSQFTKSILKIWRQLGLS